MLERKHVSQKRKHRTSSPNSPISFKSWSVNDLAKTTHLTCYINILKRGTCPLIKPEVSKYRLEMVKNTKSLEERAYEAIRQSVSNYILTVIQEQTCKYNIKMIKMDEQGPSYHLDVDAEAHDQAFL